MDFREVLTALRLRWWLPVGGLILGALAGLGMSLLATPMYTSRTQLFVSTTQTGSATDVYQGSQFSQQRVSSYAQLIAGEELAGRVIDSLGLRTSPEDLQERIRATVVPNSVLLDVSVSDPSPERARDVAGAVGTEFTRMISELERPDGASASPVKVSVVNRASLPDRPSEPRTLRNVALGGLAGLLLGAGLAVARARLDRSVRDADQAAELAKAPVIGTVLQDDALAKAHVIERNLTNRTSEDYRRLRTNLQFLSVDEPPKVIMISSALPAEGKTTLAINLGISLAEAGRRVTVVEADLRRPRVTRYLGMVAGVGLTNVLAGSADLDDVLQTFDHVTVMGAGPAPPNPGELLASGQMSAVLDKLRGANDFVIIDAPPLLPVADSTGLAPLVDGVLLSVRYGSTRTDQLEQAVATLERVHARTLGVVLNIVPRMAEIAAAYGYGYGYGYGSGKHRPDSVASAANAGPRTPGPADDRDGPSGTRRADADPAVRGA